MHRDTLVRGIVALAALTLAATACSGGSPPSPSPAQTSSPVATTPAAATGQTIAIGSDTANDKGSANVAGKNSIKIDQNDKGKLYFFSPTVISGSAGQTVQVEVDNEGTVPHTFTIDGGPNVVLQPGQEQHVKVTLPQTGSLEFYCQYHRTLGMSGEFTVG